MERHFGTPFLFWLSTVLDLDPVWWRGGHV